MKNICRVDKGLIQTKNDAGYQSDDDTIGSM